VIPFSLSKFGSGDITPQKVKGALFSILGEDLSGRTFLDLFGGSGQIGIEALSRGAISAVFVEADKRRASFIRDVLEELDLHDRSQVLPFKYEKALKVFSDEGARFDIIFCDPPYEKIKGEAKTYKWLLNAIDEAGILSPEGIIAVQHFGSNILPEKAGALTLDDTRHYGATSLSFYTEKQGSEPADK